MNATQLTADLANRLNDVKVLRWHFDPELTKISGKLTFWGKHHRIVIELRDEEDMIMMIPRIVIGGLNTVVVDRVVIDIKDQARDEDEAYDLVMATVRGIANKMK
jgi:hypothetical protein